jgi:hypothetical protein
VGRLPASTAISTARLICPQYTGINFKQLNRDAAESEVGSGPVTYPTLFQPVRFGSVTFNFYGEGPRTSGSSVT